MFMSFVRIMYWYYLQEGKQFILSKIEDNTTEDNNTEDNTNEDNTNEDNNTENDR